MMAGTLQIVRQFGMDYSLKVGSRKAKSNEDYTVERELA
jgi:hypothetical protein